MPVSLGLPLLPPPAAPAWRTAWDQALYGAEGFFRRQPPAGHFRTAVHTSQAYAEALLTLARSRGLDTVVDVGAGRGELLQALHRLAPDLDLLGVEVAARPAGLPAAIGWAPTLPATVEGLVVANEWLDNVPCHVVEVDDGGVPRLVHVDPATGEESLGHPVDAAGVPASVGAWLARWWPLTSPGSRAEVGTSRDRAWADVVRRLRRGIAVAVDYGHLAEARPPLGSLRSYRDGREVPVLPDGSRDVTAHVAVDAVAAAGGGEVVRQRDALARVGVTAARPELALAAADPSSYLTQLGRASSAALLTDPSGFGDYYWVVSAVGVEGLPG